MKRADITPDNIIFILLDDSARRDLDFTLQQEENDGTLGLPIVAAYSGRAEIATGSIRAAIDAILADDSVSQLRLISPLLKNKALPPSELEDLYKTTWLKQHIPLDYLPIEYLETLAQKGDAEAFKSVAHKIYLQESTGAGIKKLQKLASQFTRRISKMACCGAYDEARSALFEVSNEWLTDKLDVYYDALFQHSLSLGCEL